MAQKDYVRRGKGLSSRRKKDSGKRQRSSSLLLIGIAVIVVLLFIAGLYFISHNQKSPVPRPAHTNNHNGLPPKPEERWRYIKELENRQPGLVTPMKPAPDTGNDRKRPLTEEQKQILQQIQADMRQQPTQLHEVPWNGEAVPATTPSPSASSPVTLSPATPQPPAVKPVPVKPPASVRWLIQCGSFKNVSQAETVRAQLAFEGFESHIAASDDWQRVIVGSFASKEKVDATLNQLKAGGHNQCIRLAVGG